MGLFLVESRLEVARPQAPQDEQQTESKLLCGASCLAYNCKQSRVIDSRLGGFRGRTIRSVLGCGLFRFLLKTIFEAKFYFVDDGKPENPYHPRQARFIHRFALGNQQYLAV